MKLPVKCNRCPVGELQWDECKYTGERFFMCHDCGGMWRDLDSALKWKITGGQNGPNASLNDSEYLESVGRPDHFLDDPNYQEWTNEEWNKYNEPWINFDAEFNAQQDLKQGI